MKQVSFLILVYFYFLPIYPQWTNYNTVNTKGLNSTLVSDILISGTNTIWFATEKALVKNDITKQTWTEFNNLPNNFIYDLETDKEGYIWAGTNGGGAVKYNGNTFTTYNTSNGLASNIVRAITKDKAGKLWFATYGGGLSCFNGTTFMNYGLKEGLSGKYFYSAYCDSKGILWFGTAGLGVVSFDGAIFKTINTADGLVSNNIIKIYEDKKGRLWFCGQGGLSIYDGTSFKNLTKADGLSDDLVYCVFEDEGQNFLIGTDKGLNTWDENQVGNIDTTNFLSKNSIICIAKDQKNRYWYGHSKSGVSCFDGNTLINYLYSNGLTTNNVFKAVEGKDGKIWFATYTGLTCYDGYTWKTYKPDSYYNPDLRSIEIDEDGNIWAMGNYNQSKIYKFDGKKWEEINIPDADNNSKITAIIKDKQGGIWLAYYKYSSPYVFKILYYFKGNWTIYENTITQIDAYIFNLFIDSKGRLWVATNVGLVVKSGNTWEKYTSFNTSNFANNRVQNVIEDHDGNIWIACYDYNYGGVCKFDGIKWTTYRDILHTSYVTTLFIDSHGMLWIGGYQKNYNITKVFTTYKNGVWGYIESTPELPSYSDYNYIFEDKSANIWVCSNYGVSMANLSEVSIEKKQTNSFQNLSIYPNPFKDKTLIKINQDKPAYIEINISNIEGKVIRNEFYNNKKQGLNEITIEKGDLKPGIYFCRLRGENINYTTKLIVL